MQNGTLEAWKKFAAFEVFGDYAPMSGFRLVIKVGTRIEALHTMLEARAPESELLDPHLARWVLRAGLGLSRSGVASFVYATPEEVVVVVRSDALRGRSPLFVHDQLVSLYTARLSLLAGRELPALGQIYEFPDVAVIRKAITSLVEDVEEATPMRSSIWLGAQLRGRGQAFHPSMVETLEEQTSLLSTNGVDMNALPAWWWRGIAAAVRADGAVEVYDELPHGEALGALIRADA